MTLKSPGEIFSLRGFPIYQQITVLIYFLLHLVFLVICWCLHDLHAIEPN